MLLLFLALTFLSSLLVPISSPLRPEPGVTFLPPILQVRKDACLLCQWDRAGAGCLHPTSISAAARTTVAVEKSS